MDITGKSYFRFVSSFSGTNSISTHWRKNNPWSSEVKLTKFWCFITCVIEWPDNSYLIVLSYFNVELHRWNIFPYLEVDLLLIIWLLTGVRCQSDSYLFDNFHLNSYICILHDSDIDSNIVIVLTLISTSTSAYNQNQLQIISYIINLCVKSHSHCYIRKSLTPPRFLLGVLCWLFLQLIFLFTCAKKSDSKIGWCISTIIKSHTNYLGMNVFNLFTDISSSTNDRKSASAYG